MGAKLGGGGGGRYSVEQNSDINVTPFVDVMLVLLIIFMVSIPPATISIKLDLPPAVPSNNPIKKEPVFISVMGQGDIYVSSNGANPKKTDIQHLAADLTAALASNDPHNERVLIRGYKDIEYADFMEVLNELQNQGFKKVGLVNEDIE